MAEVVEVVVASGKGGVGKSTLTAELAIEAAKRHRLVAADADAEAPNLHLVLGVREWSVEEEYREGRRAWIRRDICIYPRCRRCIDECPLDAIIVEDGGLRINPWVCEGCLTCSLVCPVKAIRYEFNVLAGWIRVAETSYGFRLVSAEIVPGRPNSGKLVTEVKNRAKSLLGAEGGVLLVDAAAGIGCQVVSSMTGAQLAILVAEPTPASLSDLERVHKLAKHFGLASFLVINKHDLNEAWRRKLEEYAERNKLYILGYIPFDELVPKAISMLKPVSVAFPSSKAARAMKEIARFFAEEVLPEWRDWWRRLKPEKPEPYVPIVLRPGGDVNPGVRRA